jgi:hypothetical protein
MALNDFLLSDGNKQRRQMVFGAPNAKAAGTGVRDAIGSAASDVVNADFGAIADNVARAAPVPALFKPAIEAGIMARKPIGKALGGAGDFADGLLGLEDKPKPQAAAVVPVKKPVALNPPTTATPGLNDPTIDVPYQPTAAAPRVAAPNINAVPLPKFGAKGGLFGSLVDFNSQLSAYGTKKAGEGAKVTNFKNQIAANQANTQADASAVNTERAQVDLEGAKTKQAADAEVNTLRKQIFAETDPKKRQALQSKLYSLIGKPQPKYQIVSQKGVDATGNPIETPMIVEEGENGVTARPLVQAPQIQTDPKAMAIRDDKGMSIEQKRAALQALGYK